MKIRNGFVSNSSSSSFLVIFPREPKSIEDVKQMLFGDDATLFFEPYDTSKVAETVFDDIKKQNKNNIEGAIKELSNSCDSFDYKLYKNVEGEINWDEYEDACIKWAKEKFENFYSLKKIRKDKLRKIEGEGIDTNNDEIFYIFEYSDNSGSYYAALEHGNIFNKLKHIKISKH